MYRSVDSQFKWLNLQKLNLMRWGMGVAVLVTAVPQDIFKSKARASNCQSQKLGAGDRGRPTRNRERDQRPLQEKALTGL